MIRKIIKAIKMVSTDQEQFLLTLLAKLRLRKVSKIYKNRELFHSYKGELFPDYLNHGNASQFIFEKAKIYCEGYGIDVGASLWPFPGSIPIQDEPHQNAYRLDQLKNNSLDYVFSSHCLEHLERWEQAITLWIQKLKPGEILLLYLPHESMKLWEPGGPWVGNDHKWQPRHEILIPFLKGSGIEIIEYNSFKDDYWSFHIVGKKVPLT